MTPALQRPSSARRERGTALVVALLFLMIIAMLGTSSMTTTTLEEQMSGNAREQHIALQAAEAALRNAEQDLTNLNATYRVISSAGTQFVALCTNALCTQGAALTNLDNVLTSAYYGQFRNQLAVPDVSQQPRYMLELLAATPPAPTPAPPAGSTLRNVRISAKGYGRNANTVVILQTVYQLVLPN